jgi:hypothetical protein
MQKNVGWPQSPAMLSADVLVLPRRMALHRLDGFCRVSELKTE